MSWQPSSASVPAHLQQMLQVVWQICWRILCCDALPHLLVPAPAAKEAQRTRHAEVPSIKTAPRGWQAMKVRNLVAPSVPSSAGMG